MTSSLTSSFSVINVAFSDFSLLLVSTLSNIILLWYLSNRLLRTLFGFAISSANLFSIYLLISFSFSTLASHLALFLNIFYDYFISRYYFFSHLPDSSRIFVLYSLFNYLIHVLYNSSSIFSILSSKFLTLF